MKLRIRGDSLRLRVVRAEFDELVRTGAVADSISFPGGRKLQYQLHVRPDVTWSAALDEQGMSIGMPQAIAERSFHPAEMGCRSELRLSGGRPYRC